MPRSISWRWFRPTRLALLDVLEMASNRLPLDILKQAAGDWDLIEDGDDTTGGYRWENPHQCVCGLSWDVLDASAFFNAKPTAQDIATLYATIQYPDTPSERCDGDCESVVQGRYKRFRIFKNKTTGQFWLFCTKRVQWHCEHVEL